MLMGQSLISRKLRDIERERQNPHISLRMGGIQTIVARLARNLASAPGREDYLQVRLARHDGELWADPVFGKSNLIYTLIRADGLLKVPLDVGGLSAGALVEVVLF